MRVGSVFDSDYWSISRPPPPRPAALVRRSLFIWGGEGVGDGVIPSISALKSFRLRTTCMARSGSAGAFGPDRNYTHPVCCETPPLELGFEIRRLWAPSPQQACLGLPGVLVVRDLALDFLILRLR